MPVIEKVGIRLIAHIQTHRLGQSCCNPEGMQGMVEGGQGGWGGEAAGGWYGAAFASGILYCRSLKTPLVNKITILCTLTASTNQTNTRGKLSELSVTNSQHMHSEGTQYSNMYETKSCWA